MSILFYNSLTHREEPFIPRDPNQKKVSLYTCGPTIYDHAHIGNFRAYIFEDLLQRHLEARGYQVNRVMNLTDVDDKTIRGAHRCGKPLSDYTAPYREGFFQDCQALRLRPANTYPAATDPENIEAMIAMIEQLLAQGNAYQAEDGSVYFRISSFPQYGQLAHVDLSAQQSSGRVKHDEYSKEEIADFALWKAHTSEDEAVSWDTPWGKGRPGWHIECSAMARRLLGDQLDIHCGGVDNIFPHHEAEIAQCEAITKLPFVRYWMHCAHLRVNGEKMSKSAGNFYTVHQLLQEGWEGREIRYALLCVHYRASLNFTKEGLEAARQALLRIDAWLQRLHETVAKEQLPANTPASSSSSQSPHQHLQPLQPLQQLDAFRLENFFEQLDQDLNIAAALGFLFELLRYSNRLLDEGKLSAQECQQLLQWWEKVNSILEVEKKEHTPLPPEITQLLTERLKARASKNWSASDRLREQLAAHGYQVKDSKKADGTLEQKVVFIGKALE